MRSVPQLGQVVCVLSNKAPSAPRLVILPDCCQSHLLSMSEQVLFVAAHAGGDATERAAPGLLAAAVAALRDRGRSAGERLAAVRLLAALANSGSEAALRRLAPDLLGAAAAVRQQELQGMWVFLVTMRLLPRCLQLSLQLCL